MAVLAEAFSVIVRITAIETKYPGGWPAFCASAPNQTLCCDSELARIGFMAPLDMLEFVGQLEQLGLVYVIDGQPQDFVITHQYKGFQTPCTWAEFGYLNLGEDEPGRVAGCRLTGSTQRLFVPAGWDLGMSLSVEYYEDEPGDERMELLRHENGGDVYRDRETGREVYVGRT